MKNILIIACIFLHIPKLHAEDVCDSSLMKIKNQSFGYHMRGDYCEGLYEENYSNRVDIKLIGYHFASFDYVKGVHSNAKISVAAPKDQWVHTIISDNLRSKFYRRDQRILGGETINWSLKVINNPKVSLFANQLIGMACLPRCFEDTDIYFPINVTASNNTVADPILYLELPVNSKKVRLRIVDQKTKEPIIDKNTKKILSQIRTFETRVVGLIETFSFPVLDNNAYLEVDVLLEESKEKIISRSFLLGAIND